MAPPPQGSHLPYQPLVKCSSARCRAARRHFLSPSTTASAPPDPLLIPGVVPAICAAGVGRAWSSPTWSGPEGSSHNDFATGRPAPTARCTRSSKAAASIRSARGRRRQSAVRRRGLCPRRSNVEHPILKQRLSRHRYASSRAVAIKPLAAPAFAGATSSSAPRSTPKLRQRGPSCLHSRHVRLLRSWRTSAA